MGHHSAAFTLETYRYRLEGDLGPPLDPWDLTSNGRSGRPRALGNATAMVLVRVPMDDRIAGVPGQRGQC
jgi:hypothetical protein